MTDLERIYSNIDKNLDWHISRIQECIRQPSISQTGEGIEECGRLFARYFSELGCDRVIVEYPGMTKWGIEGNPVVYGEYDAGAEKTLIVYFMYDTMPIYDEEKWIAPPHEARIVEQKPFKKVIIGRGAINTKGPALAFLNACSSIIEVEGILPVNLLLLAEGDEERMSIGLHKFVHKHKDELCRADAVYPVLIGQDENGNVRIFSGSEGCIYFELETSGARWGRGPTKYSVHGINKRWLDSPAWRHIRMLATLVSEDGNTVEVEGWYDGIEEPSKEDLELIEELVEQGCDSPELLKERLGAKTFIDNITDHRELLVKFYWSSTLNLDGIWGGRILDHGAGSTLPYKVTSKHNCRYIPNQSGDDLVRKLRKHLDKKGYTDVEIRVIGDVPWARANYNSDLAKAIYKTCEAFGVPYSRTPIAAGSDCGPYWPAYLFSRDPLHLQVAGGSLGHGGRAHAINEYYVIEGQGKVFGLAGAEKSHVSNLYNYAEM